MLRVVLAWLVAFGVVVLASGDALAQLQPGAAALESRLNAPCCYGGTLDMHDSELARDLRKEIEERLAHGETSDAIQADFVERYGERVIAARSDKPIAAMTLSLLALMAAAAVGVSFLMRRWTRRPVARPTTTTAVPTRRDELDDRLDAELVDFDDEPASV